MGPASVVAMGYRYPNPTRLEPLGAAIEGLDGAVGRRMARFLQAVGRLELGKWEELHTRTLDLSPLFIPYVGYVVWGENYRRGEFMADLKRDMERCGVDLAGELPDHLDPVLRYLELADPPMADLVEELPRALAMMEKALKKAESDNPYRHLLAATVSVVDQILPTELPLESGAQR